MKACPENEPKNEQGNVLFYILIAIALLAALIFAVSQSGRGSISQISQEKSKLLSNAVLEYASAVGNASAQLRLRGCKLTELNFENSVVAGYENTNAPVDKSCNIFHTSGGGITFQYPPAEAFTAAPFMIFTIEMEIQDVGTSCGDKNCSDLLMATGPLSEAVCIAINNSLSVGSADAAPIADEAEFDGGLSKYIGDVEYEMTIGDKPASATIKGKSAACIKDTDHDLFYFYKVLQAR